jgi:hypothetical protein
VPFREVVNPARQAAYRTFQGEPVQSKIDRFTTTPVQEVARNERTQNHDPTRGCEQYYNTKPKQSREFRTGRQRPLGWRR